ncbi:DoxX family protein [Parafrankia elaeagni]|uniref:DoxX family protein n=1 Tax=Parafrankia elaeagni TaxID=222534 RepID=UPI00036E7B5F|nr:DoxX family protein [Parafrankia elaeagni]
MNVTLWIIQGLLAAAFALAGVQKATQPKDKLVGRLPWVEDFSQNTVRFIGVVELLAALGLVLPRATGIAPVLTPLAATGLAITMALAAVTHLRRREPSGIAVNAVLLGLAVLVAWGRFGPYGP